MYVNESIYVYTKQFYKTTQKNEGVFFSNGIFFCGGFPTKILRFEEHLIRFSVKFFEIIFFQLAYWYGICQEILV